MKVIGLVGSARKLGNTEIMVKEALQAVRVAGGEAELIRLSELSIKPCTGCMVCIFHNACCPIQDDMPFLVKSLRSAEALLIGAPTYILSPAGILKMVTDRLFMIASAFRDEFRGKRAGTIATAGARGWEPFALPLLNILPLSMGYSICDSFIAHAPGPGEILLDESLLIRARTMGTLLCSGADEDRESTRERPECPLCRGCVFTIKTAKEIECACCSLKGTLDQEGKKLLFTPRTPLSHRWTEEAMNAHMEGWIKTTEGRFKEHMREILKKRRIYKDMTLTWLTPERQGEEERS
jgi:multimeric flavodoxin WrbA